MACKPLATEDLDHVLRHTAALWPQLAGKRLFITGGTGFFGKWILESTVAANDRLNCEVKVTVLSRDPARFKTEMPHLARRSEIDWLQGHPANFAFPEQRHDYILHLATATSAYHGHTDATEMLKMKLASISHVLSYARYAKVQRILVTSSGAVYGPQPPDVSHIPESYSGAPDPLDPASAYGTGKRLVEQMCALATDIDFVIARCFSFIGPHLPLDARFAAGNFLRDAMAGGPIVVNGDGRAVRSYLYAADMVVWLLTILLQGKAGRAYNVGSDQAVDILDLAQSIAALAPQRPIVRVTDIHRDDPANRYVPDISRAGKELGLQAYLPINESITRTSCWLNTGND